MIETFTVQANSLRFHCRAAGEGPLVLCLHGFPDTAHSFDALLPVLAEAGYRAVAPFMRGYAPTEVPADGDYSMQTLARDVTALADALGAGDVRLIGHDWGGFAACGAANTQPGRIRKLVVMAVPHMAAPRFTPAQLKRSWYVWLFQLPWLPERKLAENNFSFIDRLYREWSPSWLPTGYDLEPVKAALAAPGGLKAALGYYRAMIRGSDRASREMLARRTSVPSLWLVGAEDGSIGVDQFDGMAKAFTGPFRKVVVAGAGHFPHREQPDVVLAEVLPFLSE